MDALFVSLDGFKRREIEIKTELTGKAYSSHHAQRVIGESDIWVEGRSDDALLHILHSTEGVEQEPIAIFIETDGEGVDGEISAILIVFQCAILYDGVSALAMIRLFPCAYKLQFHLASLHLCRTEIAEYRKMGASKSFMDSFGQRYSRTDHNYVDILARAMQKEVAHPAANHVAFEAQFIGLLAHQVEGFIFKKRVVYYHSL